MRLRVSMDSARPRDEANGASGSRDDDSDSGSDTAEPLSMEHKSGCRQWPPYQHTVADDPPEDEEPGDEPQLLTQDIKQGALAASSSERASCAYSAFRPPPGPFRVSAVAEACMLDKQTLAKHIPSPWMSPTMFRPLDIHKWMVAVLPLLCMSLSVKDTKVDSP